MVIDEVTLELKRMGGTATLLVQGRPYGWSIKITLRELEGLAAELMEEARVWRQACEQNYYTVLGVDRTASADEIKKAYRKLARTHHPDLHGGDEEKLKVINNAYETLGNQAQRRQYDLKGEL